MSAGKKNWDKSPTLFETFVHEPLFLGTSKPDDTYFSRKINKMHLLQI